MNRKLTESNDLQVIKIIEKKRKETRTDISNVPSSSTSKCNKIRVTAKTIQSHKPKSNEDRVVGAFNNCSRKRQRQKDASQEKRDQEASNKKARR